MMNPGQSQYGGQFQQPHPQQQQQKGCWGRHWKWLVPAGCLSLILGLVALFAVIFFVAMSAIKSSEVYRGALVKAQTHPAALAALGSPVKDGWFVQGNVSYNGGGGNAKLDIPVSGPKKSGSLHVLGTTTGGAWTYERLDLTVEGETISLLDRGRGLAQPGPAVDVEEDADDAAEDGVEGGEAPAANAAVGPAVRAGVLNGKALSLPAPAYPPAAKAARAAGVVTVEVTVDETGQVLTAEAVSGHPLLRAAAVQAARQARLAPTLSGGKPVKVSGVLTYNFVLD